MPPEYGWVEETPVVSQRPRAAAKVSARASGIAAWSLLRYSADADPAAVARDLGGRAVVAQAQPNYLRSFASPPDDPLFAEQDNLAAIGWDQSLATGGGVVVAIIDSGIDQDHPDLASQLWRNPEEADGLAGVDDDGNGYVDDVTGWDFTDAPGLPGDGDFRFRDSDPDDESGHGTHVAGIVAAAAGNRIGVAGVAPGVRLMALRAGFTVSGTGFLEDDDIAAAAVYAVDQGADILNMSFGDPVPSPVIRDVVRYARSAGCLVVAAVGNEGSDEVFYPARMEEVVAVAATDDEGQPLAFSNWGYSVDIAAPGLAVHGPVPGGEYAQRSGTSMATAHVSGVAAVTWSRQPQLTAWQVRGALANSAADVGAPGWDRWSGAGLVQMAAARISEPAAVSLTEPASGVVRAGEVTVRGRVWGKGVEYDLTWGRGPFPESVELLLSGTTSGADNRFEARWPAADLPPGPYLLRLQAVAGGRTHSQRILLDLRPAAAEVSDLRLARALDGPGWSDILRWETDAPEAGTVALLDATSGDTVLQIPLGSERLEHSVPLPADLLPGEYTAIFLPAADAAVNTGSLDIAIGDTGIRRWTLMRSGMLPDGYLLPQPTDFDGDGIPEIVAMGYGGPGYNPAGFFELPSGFRPVHLSSRPFIPWNAHDLDGDSRSEIMAVDAERVRLVESAEPGSFPTEVAFEVTEVWGGEVGDGDGDGRMEMFLRSSRSEQFRVFENTGDDSFAETGVLPNPSEGLDGLGDRQVAGDLDGDGNLELLAGDEDGDIFIYESIADDTWRNTWLGRLEAGDSRVLGGAFDTDADGRLEFAVASLDANLFDPGEAVWTLAVVEAAGDNRFEPRWSVEVVGGASGGNGISSGDFDADGVPEIAVALVPDLYLLRADPSGAMEPVWHMEVSRVNRPLVADVDADGIVDLVASSGEALQVHSLPFSDNLGLRLDAPASFSAHAGGEQSVLLSWTAVPGARRYRLFRADGDEGELRVLVESLRETAYEDRDVLAGTPHRYAVAALDSLSGEPGHRSREVTATPEPNPRIEAVLRAAENRLSVRFDTEMGREVGEHFRYRIEGFGIAGSAAVHAGARRVLLTFSALPAEGELALVTRGLRNSRGTPLGSDTFLFALFPPAAAIRLLGAEPESPTRLVLHFSEPVVLDGDGAAGFAGRHFEVDGGRVRVEDMILDDGRVILLLSEETPLRAAGRRYEVAVVDLADGNGRRVQGVVFVQLSAPSLDEVSVFPNPYDPALGEVTVAGLPVASEVTVATIAGEVVWTRTEEDGDGGVRWDGRNAGGSPVASGLYLVRIGHQGVTRLRKLAVIRDAE